MEKMDEGFLSSPRPSCCPKPCFAFPLWRFLHLLAGFGSPGGYLSLSPRLVLLCLSRCGPLSGWLYGWKSFIHAKGCRANLFG